jgi:hypothetical protein
MASRRTVGVIGANAFSRQDFIDLPLDQPDTHVIGVNRSPERSAFMLRHRQRSDQSRYQFRQIDMNERTTRGWRWVHQFAGSARCGQVGPHKLPTLL